MSGDFAWCRAGNDALTDIRDEVLHVTVQALRIDLAIVLLVEGIVVLLNGGLMVMLAPGMTGLGFNVIIEMGLVSAVVAVIDWGDIMPVSLASGLRATMPTGVFAVAGIGFASSGGGVDVSTERDANK